MNRFEKVAYALGKQAALEKRAFGQAALGQMAQQAKMPANYSTVGATREWPNNPFPEKIAPSTKPKMPKATSLSSGLSTTKAPPKPTGAPKGM